MLNTFDDLDFNKIRQAVADLRRMGIVPSGFECSHETVARLEILGLPVEIVQTAPAATVGPRLQRTLCGIPITMKD